MGIALHYKGKMDFLAGKIEMLGDILDANSEKLGEAKSVDDLADRMEELLRKFGFKKN